MIKVLLRVIFKFSLKISGKTIRPAAHFSLRNSGSLRQGIALTGIVKEPSGNMYIDTQIFESKHY